MADPTSARRALAIGLLLLCQGPAWAADTGNMGVAVTVAGACAFTSVPSMGFTLDPATGAAGTASTTVQYKCTRGTAAGTFTVGPASNGATGYTSGASAALGALAGTGGNTDVLQFTITWTNPTAFTGSGFSPVSTAKSVLLNGSIPFASYANARADTYSGSVAIGINP